MSTTPVTPVAARRTLLDRIEWLGNKLPEPALIFAILSAAVILASAIGTAVGWKVQPVRVAAAMQPVLDTEGRPVLGPDGRPQLTPKLDSRSRPERTLEPVGAPLEPRSLLTREGIYWMLSSMVRNFTGLPALGLVFVAMLGIGLAEKFGLFSALMRYLALLTPRRLLTPVVVFVGANASIEPSGLVRQIGALDQWISSRWPDCRRHAEIPIESVLPNGQVMHGRIDLLLETGEGWVLLDHKANPAPRDRWDQVAVEHGGQLAVYADALTRATGRPVTETWIVLPVAAGVIQVTTDTQ